MEPVPDRRQYPRFEKDERVRLSVLGSENSVPFDVRIVDASARGMRIASEVKVRPGSLIQVEGHDTLLLGEVLYCAPAANDNFFLGVELTQALFGLAELRKLNQSLLAEQSGARVPIREQQG